MNSRTVAFGLSSLAILFAVMASLRAQAPEPATPPEPAGPGLYFRNSTAAPLDVYRVQPDDGEKLVIKQLASGKQSAAQPVGEGDRWRIKVKGEKEHQTVAEYVANSAAEQTVDLANLIEWQSPVELVIQNNGKTAVDVIWLDEAGEEKVQTKGLEPEQEVSASTFPGSRWRLREGDEIVAEYSMGTEALQELDVISLKKAYAGMITVAFKNTLEEPVDVFWIHPDGHEVEYVRDLPAGKQFDQQGFPNQLWSIRSKGAVVAYYRSTEVSPQEVDVAQYAKATQEVLAALAAEPDPGAEGGLFQVTLKPGQPPILAVRGPGSPTAADVGVPYQNFQPPTLPAGAAPKGGAGAYRPLADAPQLVDLKKLSKTPAKSEPSGPSLPKPSLPKPLPKPKKSPSVSK